MRKYFAYLRADDDDIGITQEIYANSLREAVNIAENGIEHDNQMYDIVIRVSTYVEGSGILQTVFDSRGRFDWYEGLFTEKNEILTESLTIPRRYIGAIESEDEEHWTTLTSYSANSQNRIKE